MTDDKKHDSDSKEAAVNPTNTPMEDRVLNCTEKDASGLNDFHRLPDMFGIDIDKVGINRFRIPLNFKHKDGTVMNHDSEASMYIAFPRRKAGINMSRLYQFLGEEAEQTIVGPDFFRNLLGRYRRDMRDDDTEPLFPISYLKIRFKYPVKQKSLKSDNWGWQYYNCTLEGREGDEGDIRFYMTVCYEYSSTCPCSLSMSKQYEDEFSANATDEGNGMAVAHSQRSQAKVTVQLDVEEEFYIEDLVDLLRSAIPTETQSFVKRVDEQAFAVLNAQNPMFVEHATRRISHTLNQEKRIIDWVAAVEHWESLHSHNAVAVIRKGIKGGLK